MDAVEVFNALPADRLEDELLACCAAPAWGAAVAAIRPYPANGPRSSRPPTPRPAR